jgi:hypothetical protein
LNSSESRTRQVGIKNCFPNPRNSLREQFRVLQKGSSLGFEIIGIPLFSFFNPQTIKKQIVGINPFTELDSVFFRLFQVRLLAVDECRRAPGYGLRRLCW